MKTSLALPCFVILAATSAHADNQVIELVPTCVAIDAAHDALAPEARAIALRTLERVLEQADQLVVDTGCRDTYTLSHERLADGALVVHVHGPHGGRELRAEQGELAAAYRTAVKSLLAGSPAAAAAIPIDPYAPSSYSSYPSYAPGATKYPTSAAAASSPAPAPTEGASGVPAQRVTVYGTAGVAPMANADPSTTLGCGVRFETNGYAFDGQLLSFSSGDGSRMTSGARAAGRMLRELSPRRTTSLYFGGGIGAGTVTIDRGAEWMGNGLDAIATIGAEFARANHGGHVFAQLDLVAPMYTLSAASALGTLWTPSAMFSIGLGLGN